MKLTLLAFGITKDIFETSAKEIEVEENLTVKQLKFMLEEEFPALKKLKSYFVAVDDEYADDDMILKSINEIAVIPPVSGG